MNDEQKQYEDNRQTLIDIYSKISAHEFILELLYASNCRAMAPAEIAGVRDTVLRLIRDGYMDEGPDPFDMDLAVHAGTQKAVEKFFNKVIDRVGSQ